MSASVQVFAVENEDEDEATECKTKREANAIALWKLEEFVFAFLCKDLRFKKLYRVVLH